MDACLELIVDSGYLPEGITTPKSSESVFGKVEDAEKYLWGRYLSITKISLPEYILSQLPEKFQKIDLFTYSLSGDALDMLAKESLGEEIDWEGSDISEFISKVFLLANSWALVFEPECDRIDFVRSSTIENAVSLLKSNLKKDYFGFILHN